MGNNLPYILQYINSKNTNISALKNQNRIIIYYQTLVDLDPLIKELKNNNKILTDITLASIHFGYNTNKLPYIHLNNNTPQSDIFKKPISQLKQLCNMGVKINLLIGGAGCAFNQLFSNYDSFYKLLKEVVEYFGFIDGFNLDIEEGVSIDKMVKLITDLKRDFPDKGIIFAPLGSSIASNSPGMGGFVYKELIDNIPKNIGIEYLNTQCYGEYSLELFDEMVDNGYSPDKIVMGMLTGQDFNSILDEIKKIKKKYPDFGGVAVWEYFNAPPDSPVKPYEWCVKVSDALSIVNIQ